MTITVEFANARKPTEVAVATGQRLSPTAEVQAAASWRSYQDIVLAAELALPHRIKGRPFQDTSVNAGDLEERLEQVQSEIGSGEEGEASQEEDPVLQGE